MMMTSVIMKVGYEIIILPFTNLVVTKVRDQEIKEAVLVEG